MIELQKEFAFTPKSVDTYLRERGYDESDTFTVDQVIYLIRDYFMDQAINIDIQKINERVRDYYSKGYQKLGIKFINFTSIEPIILHIGDKYKNQKLDYLINIWETRP